MKETEGDEFEELQIIDASKAVNNVLKILNDRKDIDLLHVNCEVRIFFFLKIPTNPDVFLPGL